MAANLRHIGADKSPFVPKNSAELTAFKAQLADLERKRLQRRVALLELKKERMMASEEEEVKLVPVLLGRTPRDKLSTVFAAQTCFRDHVLHEDPQRVAWPLLAEMKDEGDKRALHGERCLPLPRLTTTIDGYKEPFAFDDVKPWKMRPVKGGSRFIRPVSQICDDAEVSCDEHLSMEELPEYLQNAIRGMEESLDL
ncbi:hypothetical protein AAL_06617 [Moelleriella libera RCEF 2490]|uniref:Uncharacterized protein n=1 Tax=Moelleriella libera RCEF 2490 TaxID=1081109 RepID=A0A167YIB4_9HYPO|nr:hypothetical protein AAL_06617 [Moelleriella libera RCEF 2490]